MDKETKKLLRQAEKEKKRAEIEARKIERAEKKAEKERLKAERKAEREKSEEDHVRDYAKKIMANHETRGMNKDSKRTHNKDLWYDFDFFFSVVFESRAQKVKFIEFMAEKTGVNPDELFDSPVTQVFNGVKLAKSLGLELEPELSKDYPLANMELRELVLDSETF